MQIKHILQIIAFVAICQAAGIVGALFTVDAIPSWYNTLNQPSFRPPNWIFGPMWTTLYVLMGVAAWKIWRKRKENIHANFAVKLFFIHLFFNAIWSIIFFGYHQIGIALIDIIIVFGMIIWLMAKFWKIDHLATYLLIPYLIWVGFAIALNAAIFMIN